jgi:AcrR family transcriptional regulator
VSTRAKQERARRTIGLVLEVTRALLDEHGEQGVRLDEVQLRSGVSSGSIYHHFGDREGLIAAAQVERFDGAVRGDAVGLVADLAGAAHRGDPQDYLEALCRQAATVVLPERTRVRWARVSAMASCWQRPDLFRALGESFSSLVDALVAGAEELQALGVVDSGLDTRTVAIFTQTQGLGLLMNDLDPRAASSEDWVRLLQHLAHALGTTLRDGGSDGRGGSGAGSRERHGWQVQAVGSAAAPPRRLPVEESTRDDRLFSEVVELAISALQEAGPSHVRVDDIRATVGVSAGWFNRRFGDRDGLLDSARLVQFTRLAAADLDLLESATA